MQPLLPPEILDQILLFIRISLDNTALLSCSLVNQLFHSLTKLHLWYHITLSKLNPQAVQILLQILSKRPYIASYIKSLTVIIGRRGTVSAEQHIACVLPLLGNLKSVALIGGHPGNPGKRSWRQASSGLQDELAKVLRLPLLRQVVVERIDGLPLHLIESCLSLELLTLSDGLSYNLALPDKANAPRPRWSRAKLKSLTLQHCTGSLQAIVAWFCSISRSHWQTAPDISRLRHLKVTVATLREYEYLPYILSCCKSTLEVLELDPGSGVNLFYNAISSKQDPPTPLRSPPRLQSLIEHRTLPQHMFSAASSSFTAHSNQLTPGSSSMATNIGSSLTPISIAMSSPFSLSALSSLKHLALILTVKKATNFWERRTRVSSEEALDVIYSTPFEWVRRVLEEIATIPCPAQAHESHAASPPSGTAVPAANDDDAGHGQLALEHLTLDISFKVDTDTLSKISFSPLANALSSFSSAMPSLKRVEIRAAVPAAGDLLDQDFALLTIEERSKIRKSMILHALEGDLHLGVLVREGLLKISAG